MRGIDLIQKIRTSVIGDDTVLDGPFGGRRIVYADYAASGRALTFVESFIRDEVLPLYANTHTEVSASGRRTTALREEARRLIHRSVGGGPDDVVLFCGSGSTSAIDKLVELLGLRIPAALDDRYGLSDAIPESERPVVFIGPYEHHSNELPWRESIAHVVTILEDADGRVDLAQLEEELERYAGRPLKIGTFSAASNVTGIVTDVERVATLLHRHGALSCWDYGAAGPHLPIEMNPDAELAYKDAVFISPHKFVGGPGTPGVLVAKRSLFRNRVPAVPGGGTISFVSPAGHSYHPDPEVREEGGTPAIVESIRAGLAFALKDAVGANEIRRREERIVRRALSSWGANPRIEVFGNQSVDRIGIVSLGLRHPRGLLHSHFVGAVLNDLFGIQVRSGCFCAGPYLHRLLPIGEGWSRRMHAEVANGHDGAKLSLLRMSFGYFMSDAVVDYVVEAVNLIAEDGWKLLPYYRFDPDTARWHHRSERPDATPSLEAAAVGRGVRPPRRTAPESVLADYLREARSLLRGLEQPAAAQECRVTPRFESIRWFPLPGDGLAQVRAAG
jgi:selenocysteine lyase/cysteine desulfurase